LNVASSWLPLPNNFKIYNGATCMRFEQRFDAARLRSLVSYDPATGIFIRLAYAAGRRADIPHKSSGYRMTFEETAKRIIRDLMRDFGLDVPSACAIVGNFGHETGGFTKLQEIKPTVSGSRGGFGWAQWTGPRRRSYEAWCDKHTLDPTTYDANYGFAKYELQNDYAAAIKRVRLPGSLRTR
jgi:hypothetical protein